ncbi:phosphoribosylglycinamide formyltransferase [Paenibacillus mucilaginosus]|uniref:Phosphoribosylglycinamide formyltransferase n=2 Tax=Paenibacillus mucilaginosus TaxID=61624 RepID=I0BTV3_9BACL|nr:phosphoribosylglycinamide formyltransferase [Paenibacillus mucilaginosus]AEI45830.1 phosphoribosylglycinamide formyltransferase [Paenibacillus mucilaginosus KNP414]AFH65800.1 phosphoribosylglycinamide formyltransferase [Paenibacillus mucilaginosus K02]MCG7214991.1 phosphoribosylglycinamide formyltransferase [Paenibacillus mucilaginosus]WDM27199.1 phosphoribosylglycinamide formyltransferase [Paenibacillus mucilaginosus]
MIERLRIAVFASGSGSNFQALTDAVQSGKLDADIELLVCDKPEAPVVQRAEAAGVETFLFRPKDYPSREAYEAEILERLRDKKIGLVVLAGYMRILTHVLVDAYWGRMINVHPSLLPSFPGLHAVRQALNHGVKITGVTVHIVDGGLDSGPILAQRALVIGPEDTEETLVERIHEIEHELYPQVVQAIADGSIKLDDIATSKEKDGMKS